MKVVKKPIYASFSARNPPAICAGIPYLKKFASLCVKFSNLTVTNHSLSGKLIVWVFLVISYVLFSSLRVDKYVQNENSWNVWNQSKVFRCEELI